MEAMATTKSDDKSKQSTAPEKELPPADPEELAKFGPTPEGSRRALFITAFYVLFALLVGVPVWVHTTATYQAPLPYAEIRKLCLKPVLIAVRFNVIDFHSAASTPESPSEGLNSLLPSACDMIFRRLQVSGSKYRRLHVTCSLGQIRQATPEEVEKIVSSGLQVASARELEELGRQLASLEDRLIGLWTSGDQNCPSAYPDCNRLLAFTVWLLPADHQLTTLQSYLSERPDRNLLHLVGPRPLGAIELADALADLMGTHVLPAKDLMALETSSKIEEERKYSTPVSRQLPPSAVYDITVTLLNRHPGHGSKGKSVPANWIEELQEDPTLWLNRYVEKAFEAWLPFVHLDFRSQNLHAVYVEELISSRFDRTSNRQYYTRDDLSTVVNLLESYLGAAQSASVATRDLAGTNPGLHVILILDHGSDASSSAAGACPRPLRFYLSDDEDDVALVPQWGGLFIVDSPCWREAQANGSSHVDEQSKAVLAAKVVAVMRSLLGVDSQEVPGSEGQQPEVTLGSLSRAEVDSWYARRLVQNLIHVKATFTSMVGLLYRFPNMLISDYVASEVIRSVQVWGRIMHQLETNAAGHLALAQGNASNGDQSKAVVYSLGSVFADSQDTLDSINSAFYDHTVLERLSFLNDQKIGIYVPLFLPIVISLLKSVKRAFHNYRQGG